MYFDELVNKYDVPAPRYTSYPTVPFWNKEQLEPEAWLKEAKRTFEETNDSKGISLYFHLPFCESLCTYCGCNKRITKNHAVEGGYIEAALAEWNIYLGAFGKRPQIREIHLGGGTPTFFSPENLRLLIETVMRESKRADRFDFSFEGHPNNTTREHLETLYELGFNRVSFGVQDFDAKVQRAINRIQPYENVARATNDAREVGYQSVNFDLIFGLPFQTLDIIHHTIDCVSRLMPDRIAFYSYAHVPWKAPSQRGYSEADLPTKAEKRALYESGKEKLLQLGYIEVGMDHFALPGDELVKAKNSGSLHRNFMGYTPFATDLLVGLGCSAISDSKYAYAQNLKVVEEYKERTLNNQLAVFKGHSMTEEDLHFKRVILDLSCHGEAELTEFVKKSLDRESFRKLDEMATEGLIRRGGDRISVTELGFTFIRNICMVFDRRLHARGQSTENLFSRAI